MGAEVGFERIMDGVEIDMEELIRRSDAIKAIKDHSFALGDDYLEINGYGAIDDIRALPSADRWIPCTERLPSEQGQYLVTFPLCNGEPWVYVLSFCKGKFYETDDEWGDVEYDDVTAWMPLPNPWKGADDEML